MSEYLLFWFYSEGDRRFVDRQYAGNLIVHLFQQQSTSL